MKHLLITLKAYTDAALWVSLGAGFITLFTSVSDLLPVIFIMAGVGLLVSFVPEDRHVLKAICTLPSALSLLYCHTFSDVLLVAPLIAYMAYEAYTDRLIPDYYSLADFCYPAICISVGAVFLGVIAATSDWIIVAAITYIIVYIFLLRIVRNVNSGLVSTRSTAVEGALGVLIISITLIFSQPVFLKGLLAAFGAFIRTIFIPLVYLCAGIVYVISWFFSFIDPRLREQVEEIIDADEFVKIFAGAKDNPLPSWLIWIPRIAGIIVISLIAWLLIRRMLKNGRGSVDEGSRQNIRHTMIKRLHTEEKALTRFNARTPIEKIRLAYRNYMSDLDSEGLLEIEPDLTSADVRDITMDAGHTEEAAELRELYIRARYGEDEALDQDDVRRTTGLVKSLIAAVKVLQEGEKARRF